MSASRTLLRKQLDSHLRAERGEDGKLQFSTYQRVQPGTRFRRILRRTLTPIGGHLGKMTAYHATKGPRRFTVVMAPQQGAASA